MKRRVLGIAGIVGVILASATGCLRPNQHTIISVTADHPANIGADFVNFTFAQGLPSGATVQFTKTRPLGPDGKPVGVDGAAFLKVDFAPAVATDIRGVSTAAEALYPLVPFGTTNVLEIVKTQDSGNHVTYVIGLQDSAKPTSTTLGRGGNTIWINTSAIG
jgi:hypothetical protein